MRRIIVLLSLLIIAPAYAGELEQAYQKEYAYLVAEKKALEQRLAELKASQQSNLATINAQIRSSQQVFLARQNRTDQLNRLIAEASRNSDSAANDSLLLDTTLSQAKESLAKLGGTLDENATADVRFADAVVQATNIINADGQVSTTDGQFFLPDGEAVDGKVIKVGRIARYGMSPRGSGALAPSGNGTFRIWDGLSSKTVEQLADKLYPQSLTVFFYDNAEKGIDKQDEKTLGDEVEASGTVGVIILALGVVGMILVLIRAVVLSRAGSNVVKLSEKVNEQLRGGNLEQALEICKKRKSAVSKVIAATVRNLTRDRDHIEDIISESILHESTYIDRFGAAILVIAAISPLLGLLGTVTGMISTFDIITEFGTGDPKLLSSGISEALLTTKYGLVVAIPMLLIGNLLTSWARKIKSDLEQAALHMINTHKAA